jgi:ABC-type glycerol-3-phosphate transport system permease component
MKKKLQTGLIHLVLLVFVVLTLTPFVFTLNNSFRSNSELYHKFFGIPESLSHAGHAAMHIMQGDATPVEVAVTDGTVCLLPPGEALRENAALAVLNYERSWTLIRPFMVNSFLVCAVTALGVLIIASVAAYILSRNRFPGNRVVYYFIIGAMMFPGVLTFVPTYMVVRNLGLLNTYWAMILPYIAGGQVFALFVMKGFFDGLPEDLFEAARIDGAGHFQMYTGIVLPLSKPVLSVVLIMNIIGVWNNFMWPFVTQSDGHYHVIASGLYVLATSSYAQNLSTLFAAYMLSSIPLLVLFIYATRPFIRGITSGAFKA